MPEEGGCVVFVPAREVTLSILMNGAGAAKAEMVQRTGKMDKARGKYMMALGFENGEGSCERD